MGSGLNQILERNPVPKISDNKPTVRTVGATRLSEYFRGDMAIDSLLERIEQLNRQLETNETENERLRVENRQLKFEKADLAENAELYKELAGHRKDQLRREKLESEHWKAQLERERSIRK